MAQSLSSLGPVPRNMDASNQALVAGAVSVGGILPGIVQMPFTRLGTLSSRVSREHQGFGGGVGE